MHLTTLAGLLEHEGPFASALFDVSRTTEDARQQFELRARAARGRLAEAGAPADVSEALLDRMLEPARVPGDAGRFVVATADGVQIDETLPNWAGDEVLTWGPLPDVTAWLAYRDATAPVVVVVADRVGADLYCYRAWGEEPELTRTVEGTHQHISKVPDGGMARSDLQSRTEEVWRGNAREVSAAIEQVCAAEPSLVVLAGDPRARHEIRAAVGPAVARRLVEAEHGSRADSSAKKLHADIDAAVRAAVVDRQLGTIRRLEEHIGRHNAVALGVGKVLDAAVQGSIETLVLDGDTAGKRTVRPADHPDVPLPAAARSAPELRADLLVLAAAAPGSAEAVFAGPTLLPDDGVAAMLRWDVPDS
ncbi:Vms1/Ankzf1 family peptidyl-tRNA hydrolase [Jiangella gansuensis]|uniref:baeRF2 domain-containing protein n=1 Tax=Jiangella gansuensis TaxID=281473 RepID=UPI00047BE708|nr:Vms1/Ankzf1 family peptidyl-tRNA hydrolase [Jiangella gansuensis]